MDLWALVWYNGGVNQGSFHYGKEFDNVRKRKDLTHQFRYTDVTGKRRNVYASDLQELRKKEKAIQKDIDYGINYCEGNVTAIELLGRYIALEQSVRHTTKVGCNFVLNLIRKEDFYYFFPTFGRKDMPSYTAICHREKMVGWRECSETPGESGISWYKFA